LTKIARSLHADTPANLDQTMIAVYRANPDAFGGNINILRRGAVLRIPGADQIAALNQAEAMSEVHQQMSAWHEPASGAGGGHLRLVTPGSGGNAGVGGGESKTAAADMQALRDRVKDLEGQLAESHRLIDIRNSELSALQRKLGVPAPAPAPASSTPAAPSSEQAAPAPAAAPTPLPAPAENASTPTPVPAHAAPAAKKPTAAPVETGSWIDWVAANWWVPAAVIAALIVVLVI